MTKEKEKIMPIEKRRKPSGIIFSSLMAIISLLAGIYLIMLNYGLYQQDIPRTALIVILILTGLTSLMQISKIAMLKRMERIKERYI